MTKTLIATPDPEPKPKVMGLHDAITNASLAWWAQWTTTTQVRTVAGNSGAASAVSVVWTA